MRSLLNYLPCTWRDLVAETVLLGVVAGVVVVLVVSGGGDGRAAAGKRVQFGTLAEGKPAPDMLTPTSKKSTAPKPEEKPEEKPAPRKEPEKASVWTDKASASVADRPAPTAVEETPRPMERMTVHEMNRAVENYRDWVHKGQLQVSLNFDAVTARQVGSIADFFVLQTESTRVKVDIGGMGSKLEGIPKGKLLTDLHRAKWPPVLEKAAGEWLGPASQGQATLFLSTPTELRLYRLVGKAVREQPKANSFVLKLKPSDNERDVDLELASIERLPEQGEKP